MRKYYVQSGPQIGLETEWKQTSSTFSRKILHRRRQEPSEELAMIESFVRLLIEKTETEAGEDSQDFGGMFISEAELNSILQAVSSVLKLITFKLNNMKCFYTIT
jgi:hypothetical protein